MKYPFNTAMTTSASAVTAEAITFADIKQAVAQVDAIYRPAEEALERLFRQKGFDIAAGDLMLVPTGTDISGVPPRYRNQVRVARLIDRPMFMKGMYAAPILF
jgi:hypothetical protein